MFGILAKSLKIAAGSRPTWDAPSHWTDNDHRTRAQKERDAQERRRWMRQTGIM